VTQPTGLPQRPLLLLHTIGEVQPVLLQPGAQLPASQTVAGGAQSPSVAQPLLPFSQRPLLRLQLKLAPQPPAVQPSMQLPLKQIFAGGPHSASD